MTHLTENQLNEYLDQMLDDSVRQYAENHLAICDQCRSRLEELAMLFSTLADLPDLPLTRDLTPNVLAHLPKEQKIPTLWKNPVLVVQLMLSIILFAASMPLLSRLGQQIAGWWSEITLPQLQFPSLAEMMHLLAWTPRLTFTLPKLPLFMPILLKHPFTLDAKIVLVLIFPAGLLWVVGNYSLLRNRPEVQE